MKYLRKFNESNGFLSNEEEIISYLGKLSAARERLPEEKFYPELVTVHPDGTVDYNGNLVFRHFNRRETKLRIQLGNIFGNFIINESSFTTLEGFPKYVRDDFACQGTDITNLVGAPEIIGGSCHFSNSSNLTSLEGIPKSVGGRTWFFNCQNLWDVAWVRDSPMNDIVWGRTPVNDLESIFRRDFKDSLDYNYIRPMKESKRNQFRESTLATVNIYRFRQALDEFIPGSSIHYGSHPFGKQTRQGYFTSLSEKTKDGIERTNILPLFTSNQLDFSDNDGNKIDCESIENYI